MQQHARPACAQYHRQRTGGCSHGRQVDQRHAHGFFCPCIRAGFAVDIAQEPVITKTTAATAGAALALTVVFNLHADRETHQRANIRRQGTVRRRHQDQFINTGQAGRDFLHAFIRRASHFVHATQDVQLLFAAHALQRVDAGIERSVLHFTQRFHPSVARIAHNGSRRLRALLQRGQAYLVCIGKTGFFAADGAHADALVNVIRAIFNDAVF